METHTPLYYLHMKGLLTITLLDIIDIWLGKSSCIYNIYSKDASEVRTQVPKTMTNEEWSRWTVNCVWLRLAERWPDLAAVFLIPKSWMWWWSRISVLLFSIHCWPGSSSLLVVTFVVTSQYDGYLRHHQIWDILHNCHTSAQLLGEMRWEIFWLRDLAPSLASHWIIIRTGHIFISSVRMNNMQNKLF